MPYLIASLEQDLEEILAITGGGFQANQHQLRGNSEIVQPFKKFALIPQGYWQKGWLGSEAVCSWPGNTSYRTPSQYRCPPHGLLCRHWASERTFLTSFWLLLLISILLASPSDTPTGEHRPRRINGNSSRIGSPPNTSRRLQQAQWSLPILMDGEPSVGGGHPLFASEAACCNDGSPVASTSGAEATFLR
jgi:hypothetical protein